MVAFEMPDFSISTHAPRTGSDLTCWRSFSPTSRFQPTLPARGATEPAGRKQTSSSYFNPRSPHGERHAYKRSNQLRQHFNPRSPHGERPWFRGLHPPRFPISTHAPRTGSDRANRDVPGEDVGFQPTLPARGATASTGSFGRVTLFQPTLPARGATAPPGDCL